MGAGSIRPLRTDWQVTAKYERGRAISEEVAQRRKAALDIMTIDTSARSSPAGWLELLRTLASNQVVSGFCFSSYNAPQRFQPSVGKP